jgi:hypothetical protein
LGGGQDTIVAGKKQKIGLRIDCKPNKM